jgi:hypothetical protein
MRYVPHIHWLHTLLAVPYGGRQDARLEPKHIPGHAVDVECVH